MLKEGLKTINLKGLHYQVKDNCKPIRFKPWLGDSFSFLYDFIMEKSIFPKKFSGDISKHYDILRHELQNTHGKQILELATGSGSAIHFLPNDNQYIGTDISSGLLKRAIKRFEKAGFEGSDFYVSSADDLPFCDDTFDVCLCILALNFFPDINEVFQEVKRLLIPEGVFICCIPVPERNKNQSTIRGTLLTEDELKQILSQHNFKFESISCENGALLYFKAILS